MIEDPREGDKPSVTLERPRLRFGLKSLFIVMTIVCLWLGWRLARQRAAGAMVSRHQAVMDIIEENLATLPENTSYKMPPSTRQHAANFWQRSRREPVEQRNQLSRLFSDGHFYNTYVREEPLDIGLLLKTSFDTNAVSANLRQHYERKLGELGFNRTSSDPNTAIWQRREDGMDIVIDIDIETAQRIANVRIIFLHNEELSIW